MRLVEDEVGAPAEIEGIAFVLDAESADRHAVDRFDAGWQLVAPRDVVGGARGQHLDLGVAGEVLGDVAGVQLGAAVDRLAVALNDDRELHSSPCPGSSMVSGPGLDSDGIARSMFSGAAA